MTRSSHLTPASEGEPTRRATGRTLVELLVARIPHRDPDFADDIEIGVRHINTPVVPGDPWTSSSTPASSSPRNADNST